MASETDQLVPQNVARRKYGSSRIMDAGLLRVGEPVFEPDDYVLVSLTGFGVVTTIMAVILAANSHTTALIVEAMGEAVDLISYGLNLWCSWWTRGKGMKLKERVEFRVALTTTILLFLMALRIAYQSLQAMICSKDIEFNEDSDKDVPCALTQLRPEPARVIQIGLILLASYIPSVVIFFVYSGGGDAFSPDENINKASAMLHLAFDVVVQITLVVTALIMEHAKLQAVEIDSWSSLGICVFLLIGSAIMWCRYAATSHWSDSDGTPETTPGREISEKA